MHTRTGAATAPYDVVVVGGGIAGAAVANLLSRKGYRTLLAERGDYAGATTSRTSRLQHCGLGYLAGAAASPLKFVTRPLAALDAFRLARQSMLGRAEFLEAHPQRLFASEFVLPITSDMKARPWQLQLGLWILDRLGGRRAPLHGRRLSRSEIDQHPLLREMGGSEILKGAVAFREYQYNWPERIVIDLIMEGRSHGLDARNYTAVRRIRRLDDTWSVDLKQDGQLSETVTARAVVNTAGVWSDEITAMFGAALPRLSARQKGTNAVARLPAPFRGKGFFTVTEDGAPFYLMPWGDLHYLGPVDSESRGTDEDFVPSETEIAEVLRQFNKLFPQIRLSRQDVLYGWAGPRPRSVDSTSGDISPEILQHDLTEAGLPNYFVLTGCLLMTHRQTARRLLAAIEQKFPPSGGDPAVVAMAPPFPAQPQPSFGETAIRHAIEHEQARTLSDILRRRLPAGWGSRLGVDLAEAVADVAAMHLGWSAAERNQQIARYTDEATRDFAMRR